MEHAPLARLRVILASRLGRGRLIEKEGVQVGPLRRHGLIVETLGLRVLDGLNGGLACGQDLLRLRLCVADVGLIGLLSAQQVLVFDPQLQIVRAGLIALALLLPHGGRALVHGRQSVGLLGLERLVSHHAGGVGLQCVAVVCQQVALRGVKRHQIIPPARIVGGQGLIRGVDGVVIDDLLPQTDVIGIAGPVRHALPEIGVLIVVLRIPGRQLVDGLDQVGQLRGVLRPQGVLLGPHVQQLVI